MSVNPAHYCPRIQGMVNNTIKPNSTAAGITPLGVFTIFLHGLFSTTGIVENLLILIVVGFRVRRSVLSIWILNLAASDLLATSSLPVFTLFLANGKTWELGHSFCRIHSSVFFLNMFVSGFLLAAISLDRCLVVLKPVWAQNYRTKQLVVKICGIIWFMAFLCTIPFYIFRDAIPQRNGNTQCYYHYARWLPSGPFNMVELCEYREKTFAIFKLMFAFVIPLVVIVLSYIVVNTLLARRGCRRSYRFVRLVIAVVVSFIICWAPYHWLSVMEVSLPLRHPSQIFIAKALPSAATIGFLNSVLNPILYVFSCPDLCTKIRHSLSAVMETVLVEDLAEFARRRSTMRSSISSHEVPLRKKNSVSAICTKSETEMSEAISSDKGEVNSSEDRENKL
ncbi:prostaglandin D2 receptor 2-like [Periophthalmus magnuspinnatus]|uniref:prostaglandin D2 receptor 2-like n=1 Tax=Periophthalmus magnuspinnatus TaxID=409849 RepID=UPI00145C00EF|nr:prostaglandin D2 receptor 2-like [Periophthalmus magnuspinnatus]